jgi:hypothetical protein
MSGFDSILFREPTSVVADEPGIFGDLHLDLVVAAATAGREEYELGPFFFTPLRDVDSVVYRHEVFRDLETEEVREAVRVFGERMGTVRAYLVLAGKQHHRLEKERWHLDAAVAYCDAVEALTRRLTSLAVDSRGLRAFREYLAGYTGSERFGSLAAARRRALEGLQSVTYTVRSRGGRVTVSTYGGEPDYSAEVAETFARFRQVAGESQPATIRSSGSMDHVEAQIAERVARLYPTEFAALSSFWAEHGEFLDPPIVRFDREVQFYLGSLAIVDQLRPAGLSFNYPHVSDRAKDIFAEATFDLALALKLVGEGRTVVTNELRLEGPERVFVVTGPNNGGKTTFARMVGELHYLAGLGLPVPGRSARLFLPDRVFTHFEREEDIETLRGKLEDELVRVHEILDRATPDSVIVLNESFGSTTLSDARLLGTEVMRRMLDLGCLGVYVTFCDEISALGEQTVSMVSQVDPDDPARRTFEILRRPADGLAYAWAIAEKYGLTYELLRERIAS